MKKFLFAALLTLSLLPSSASAQGVIPRGRPTEWVLVTVFANSWINYGGGEATAAYYKAPDGAVCLRGLISTGVIGQSAFTLPAGFRPAFPTSIPTASNNLFGLVTIAPAGTVTISVGSNVWFSLGGVCFRGDQ